MLRLGLRYRFLTNFDAHPVPFLSLDHSSLISGRTDTERLGKPRSQIHIRIQRLTEPTQVDQSISDEFKT